MYPFLCGPQNDAYSQPGQQLHCEASDAAMDAHEDEDAAVDQDGAAYENGDDEVVRVDDEDGVGQEEVQGDHLLSYLYRTLILLSNNKFLLHY